jgi:hypothetical protein
MRLVFESLNINNSLRDLGSKLYPKLALDALRLRGNRMDYQNLLQRMESDAEVGAIIKHDHDSLINDLKELIPFDSPESLND